jgi:predicted metal-binding membrane protein
MPEAALETVLKRDRMVLAGALLALTALAWTYMLWTAASMSAATSASSMPGMDMPGMGMSPAGAVWSVGGFALTLAMWVVMMIGMMTPSAAPMILLYARVGRQARADGRPFASTFWFAGGYLLAWSGFAVAASLAQLALAHMTLITPMLAAANSRFAGLVLVAAGIYQWTPLKGSCLSQCQAPLSFLQRHGGFRRDPKGSLKLGLKHGLACIGCCWALMMLLFVGGVMNLLWVAALSILVLLEKLVRVGRLVPRVVGLVLVAVGVIFIFGMAI